MGAPLERLFKQLVVNQTQCGGEKGGSPRSHSFDMIHQQLGIPFGKPFVEELDFHIKNRFMTKGGSSVRRVSGQSH